MHQHWALSLGLLGVVLQLLGHEATPNAYGDHYYNNASVRQLRFHDFEPREESVVRDEGERRQARGFHFNASGEDVSVEMEFIIPMVKVPVKRSMQLARDAVQGLLNLRATALLNTALVVAAGAIIAGVVRLVLAPLVFTTLSSANGYGYGYGNGYGYSAKQHESRRGMRSLTQVLESQLDAHSIDVSVCAQRAICHYLQQNAAQLQQPTPSWPTAGRLINVLVHSRWLDTYLNGTAVYSAIDVARSSRSCGHAYRGCSWPQLSGSFLHRSWPTMLQYFSGYRSA